MQTFQFRLERILSWRRKEFEAEKARLGPLMAAQKRLDTVQREIAAAWDRAGRELLAGGPVCGTDLAALGGFRARLARDLEANARQRQQGAEKMAIQQGRVIEADRRVRLLEKLRHRRLDEWRAAWDRELENFAVEAFLARWRASG
jgi:flagellar export protein FliJ